MDDDDDDTQPCTSTQNDHGKQRVRIKVSGRKFECYWKTLVSKEGSIFKNEETINKFYSPKTKEYIFDRNHYAFEAIFVYMQCGAVVKPRKIGFKRFIEELVFYGFKKTALALYNREVDPSMLPKEQDPTLHQNKHWARMLLYHFMESPEKNLPARIFSTVSVLVVVLSIIVYCLSTYPDLGHTTKRSVYLIELVCNVWFTIELGARFSLALDKKQFWKRFINIVDLLSVMPFYVELFAAGSGQKSHLAFAMLRVLRISRVFRILKISRYSIAMHVVYLTIKASMHELSVLLFFIFMTMVFFASLIFQIESELIAAPEKIKSIPHTFWLVIVTITTVGYGDMVPVTSAGKLITSILTVTGIILIALPIPIVVNNFRRIYERMIEKYDDYFFDLEELNRKMLKELHLGNIFILRDDGDVENDSCFNAVH